MHIISDSAHGSILRWNVSTAHQARACGVQLREVHGLPAHGLLKGLGFPSAIALDCGTRVPAPHPIGVVMIYASRVEGLADPRGALELDCPDVVYGHTGFGHTEERGHALDEVVGHLDAHGMDTGRSHGELQSAGCCVVFPHLHIRGVFDAVDRHAVDSPTVDGVSSIVIVCERHTGDGGADRHGELAIISDITGHIGGVAIEVEGCHSILVACGVDELDAGGGDDRLALVVLLRVGLWNVHEAGGLIHDEPIAHIRIGVVLGGEPFGQLRAGDVGTCPAHIVIRLRVNLE